MKKRNKVDTTVSISMIYKWKIFEFGWNQRDCQTAIDGHDINYTLKSYPQVMWITLWISGFIDCKVSVFITVLLNCIKKRQRTN